MIKKIICLFIMLITFANTGSAMLSHLGFESGAKRIFTSSSTLYKRHFSELTEKSAENKSPVHSYINRAKTAFGIGTFVFFAANNSIFNSQCTQSHCDSRGSKNTLHAHYPIENPVFDENSLLNSHLATGLDSIDRPSMLPLLLKEGYAFLNSGDENGSYTGMD